jgi:uncharacterized protein (TIGR00369 family)
MDAAALLHFFEEQIPFNRHLGMKVEQLSADRCRLRLPFREELVGDPFRPALHGGVLSTLADTAGGLAVFTRVAQGKARVSTVDLRVDYYLPGELRDLFADAHVVRLGNRVGVAAIVLHHGDPAVVVAEGKGVYNVKRVAPTG